MDSPIIPIFGFILNRGNDLTQFFWPVLHFVKYQILKNSQIPLWNNLFLAGTPLASDPQSPIFYPLNLLALLMPLDAFFIILFVLHITIGIVGMYLLSKGAFRLSQKTSIFVALLYTFAPRLGAYLEAGHVGLIYSLAWIPFALWAALKLRSSPKIKYSVIFAGSLALTYFSHLPTFLIIAFTFGALALNKKSVLYVALSALFTLGLTAVSLLPQLAWQGYSTRYLLLETKDVYPKWSGILEAVKAVFIPSPETEKAIAVGILPAFLSILGFLKLKSKQKLLAGAFVLAISLIVLNNLSPVNSLLLNQNWFLLLRVATRFWILILLLYAYLIGLALEKYRSKFLYFLAALAVLESVFWVATYLKKPVNQNLSSAPKEVYEFLKEDNSIFRVYCLSRCLSQKEAAIYNLELLDGYATVQQKNFYQHAWGLTGSYWDYYTLSIPPYGANTTKPDIAALGDYNVKYLISISPLEDKNLILRKTVSHFLIYENLISAPRNYEIYTPNFIRVRFAEIPHSASLVLPEVYSPGWYAYLNGVEKINVLETPNALRHADVHENTQFVDFKYNPPGFTLGFVITLAALAFVTILIFFK